MKAFEVHDHYIGKGKTSKFFNSSNNSQIFILEINACLVWKMSGNTGK